MIIAGAYEYQVEKDYREAFKQEDFTNRYSDILSKYDYIVGDWGYGQLRLKGFYEDDNTKATFDTKIGTLQDYLYEYCNFGAAYFILKRGAKAQSQSVQEEVEVPSANTETVAEVSSEAVEVEVERAVTKEVEPTPKTVEEATNQLEV